MSLSRHSKGSLPTLPRLDVAASEPLTQRTVVFPVPVSAPRPIERDAAERSGTFSLRETLLFGAPAANSVVRSPSAAVETAPSPSKLPDATPSKPPPATPSKPPLATPSKPPRAPSKPRQTAESGAQKAAKGLLFRAAALDARRADGFAPELGAGAHARRWGLLSLILSLIVASGVCAALASVEVTAEAPGVLRAPNGLRPVASALAGSLTEVLVQSGEAVEAGEVIARLEATELHAGLLARVRELELVREDVARSERHDERLESEAARALQRRRAALLERLDLGAERREQRRAHDRSLADLVSEGGASRAEGLIAKEALQDASEVVSSINSELGLLDLEVADRARQAQERQSTRRTQLGRAEAGVEEARALCAASEVRAPAAGRIESLLVAPGAVIAAGAVLGNIVPSGAPRTITSFIPSREIAFVQPGAPANIEMQSLSVSEFGLARARVTRVSTDVATAAEVQSVLNETPSGPQVRVELELVDSDASARMEPLLRSGERVKIRLHRRERRLITLLFDFVRRWV